MKTYSLYDAATGLFVGSTFGTDLADPAGHALALSLNTPDGHGTVEGRHDHLSKRVDLNLLKAQDDAAATAWQAKKDQNRLARTAGGDPGEDPPAPVRTVANATHVVDYQPPPPSPDHEWNATTQRWQLSAVAQRAASEQMTRERALAALEKKTPALLRAVALGKPGALEELTALDAQIAALESS